MKILTSILLTLILSNTNAQPGTYRLGKDGLIDTIFAEHPKNMLKIYYDADMISKDVVIMPYVFDTTEAIIYYADTSSCERDFYNSKLEKAILRLADPNIYWILGYETEGIFLDERKKPISTNIIVIDYKPLK